MRGKTQNPVEVRPRPVPGPSHIRVAIEVGLVSRILSETCWPSDPNRPDVQVPRLPKSSGMFGSSRLS
jgi:hypothetical protein